MNAKKTHMLKALEKGIRYDGRGLLEFRPISIETDVSKSAEGSATVRFGGTEVIVGVKTEVSTPYPDSPNKGNLMVNAELLPLSNPEYERGPPGIKAVETARVIDRGIREAHAIDTHKLCIKEGEAVWGIIIDVCTINDEGNILDAGALGALAALRTAYFPKYEGGVLDYETKSAVKIPLEREPIAVTVYKIGPHFLVDPLSEEEECTDARLTVTITAENTLCAMQKGGEASLSVEEIDKMVEIALEQAPKLRLALG